MRNTIIFTVILFIAVIAATIFYFRDVNKDHKEAVLPLKHLPENTLLVASIKNDEVTDKIFSEFEIFDAILGFNNTEKIKSFKYNVLRNENLQAALGDSEVFISFHPDKDSVNTLFAVATVDDLTEKDFTTLNNDLAQKYSIQSTDTLGQKIYSLKDTAGTMLFATYYQKVLFASYAKNLLVSVVDKNTTHLSENQLDYFVKNNSRNTPLSIYFAHQQYANVLKHFQRREKGIFADQFAGLAGQSAWNINYKQDALMLTGESELENTKGNYIAIFRNQSKTTQLLYNYFPASTAVYMEYALSNKDKFSADLTEMFKEREETEKINSIKNSLADSTKTLSKFVEALNGNFALIEQTNQTNIGFIALKDSSTWNTIKNSLTEEYNDDIRRFKTNQLLYATLGDAFKTFSRPYVTIVDHILVVANSSSVLEYYLQDYNKKNLLTGTIGFKNFEKLQGNEANITLFVHNKNASSKITNSLTSHYTRNYRDKENYGFQDFYSWSVQLSGNRNNLSSQIYAVYKSKTALGSTADWTYALENKAITRPYVFNHSDTSQFIVIQELDHTLHAIHPSGQKMWSAVISGRIVGEIQQLEDRSLVFVTDKNRLFRINTDGKTLPGFSIGIPDEPIATPLIADINKTKAILIPTADAVYVFDMNGNRQTNWKNEDLTGRIIGPIRTFNENFIFATTEGYIYWLDQSGKISKTVNIEGDVQVKYPLTTFNNQIFIIDNKSYLYTYSADGKLINKVNIEETESAPIADFTNLNGSSNLQLVLLNKGTLRTYEIKDSVQTLFEHHFIKDIEDRPQYFKSSSSNQFNLGVSSRNNNLLYLFNENGTVEEGFPVEGQPLFYYGKINYNTNNYLLCMRRDHKLYAFKHQK